MYIIKVAPKILPRGFAPCFPKICIHILIKSTPLPPIQYDTPAPTLEDVWRMFQENARQSQEDYRVMKERSAVLSKQLGDLGNPLGEFVEHAVNLACGVLVSGQIIDLV